MNNDQWRAIMRLKKAAEEWPEGISLFSASSNLYVITDDFEIIAQINIPNDGGEIGTEVRNGKEYLCLR